MTGILAMILFMASPIRADEPAVFLRGVNLNGPGVVIDGNRWDGEAEAPGLEVDGFTMDYPAIALNPGTDRARASMIHTSRWGDNVHVTFEDIPRGVYQIFLYVWEENNAVDFRVTLNGRTVVPRYDTRSAGHWEKLGPFREEIREDGGRLALESHGKDCNLSGVEIWKGAGPVPEPPDDDAPFDSVGDTPSTAASAEGVEFYERHVRPILIHRCHKCHAGDSEKIKGGLRVDSRGMMLKGGISGPAVVPGHPQESPLIAAVKYEDESLQMPPRAKLPDEEIATLVDWVKRGAPAPGEASPAKAIDLEKARAFWSFQPVKDPPPPSVQNASWARTDIDRFVLAGLESRGLKPAPPADPRTLLRRATFDLTGLPPSPEAVQTYLDDTSPDRFARAVERLLASPQYGERWGRHWLDVVRYADTAGCNSDYPVPSAYLYRNYVINSFNADKPYDGFLREQVAGDLLPHASDEQKYEHITATGYLAIARRFGSLADEFQLTIEDNIDNLGKSVLGLSVSCARCHDHKFDPIPTKDYYALYGIFDSSRYTFPGTEIPQEPKDFVPLFSEEFARKVVEPYEATRRELVQKVQYREQVRNKARESEKSGKPGEHDGKPLPPLADAERSLNEARKRLEEHDRNKPDYRLAYAVVEGKPHDARVQRKGDPRTPGEKVRRGFLQILGGQSLPKGFPTSGRLELAGWLTDPKNPLTARVMANRIWQYHFGQGIVPTPNDFGARGLPPTHPELLDHLASRFVGDGWSIKAMHRRIMLSNSYQMAVVDSPDAMAKDPRNESLWTFPRRRLSAEEFRDALLFTSGRLDPSMGGPHPFPPPPYRFTQHNPFYGVYETDRRSVYLMQQRIKKHPFLELFDGADPNSSTALRPRNTTPTQALFLMNDPFVHDQAGHLADRLFREAKTEPERIERLYRLAFGRSPTDEEGRMGREFLKDARSALSTDDEANRDAWSGLARVIYASNEFSFQD